MLRREDTKYKQIGKGYHRHDEAQISKWLNKFSIFKLVLVLGDPKGEHSGCETAVDPADASAHPGHLLWVELGAGHLANPLRPSGQGQHHQPEE